jgi:PAS domain S-box-containing protein
MIDLARLLSTDGFMPHGMCYMWRPAILALHVGADSLIALAYFTIPFTLVYFVRKRAELRFTWIFLSFAIFIIACGASHVMEIWTIWVPMYWLAGGIKVVTALASAMTAILLVKLVPAALRLPSHSQLQGANDALACEILERTVAQQAVIELNASLEARVVQRTQQLASANELLLESNARVAIASGAGNLGFWHLNVVARTLRWDDQMFKLYGQRQEEGVEPYQLWTDSLHPEDRAAAEQVLADALACGDKFDTEYRIIRPSGEIRHIRESAAVVRDTHGLGILVHGVNFDITERKRGEEALRESEERFRSLANTIPQMAHIARADGYRVWFNQRWYDYTGTTLKEMEGWGWQSVHDPEILPDVMVRWRAAIAAGEPFDMEFPLRAADGTYRQFMTLASPQKDAGNRVIQWITTNTDITERKRADEALRAVAKELELRIITRTVELKERESMLQEIHHRVKNNLQVISSLINMQIRGLEDESSRSALRDCQSRVVTMAKIHEMLYQSADYAQVPFARYTRDLAGRVLSASGTSPGHVTLQLELEEVSLPVVQAIPCGLILNELVGNCLKHAFPNAAHGVIRVELRFATDRSVFLSVSDDGTGISPAVDLGKMTSLGMQLVMNLVEQLEGRLEILGHPGSSFRITFPLESAA